MTTYQIGAILTFITGIFIAAGMFYIRSEVKRPEDRIAMFVFGGFGLYLAVVTAVTGLNLVNDFWFRVLWAGILPPLIWICVKGRKWRRPDR